MNKVLETAAGIIYPRRCPVCDDIVVPRGQLICEECSTQVSFVSGAACMKCGKPLRDSGQEYCSDCMRVAHVYDRGYALFQYRSISGSVYRFKYAGRREYADYYAAEIVRKFGSVLRNLHPDALVPVPMYAAKQRKRGYNQAEVLAYKVDEALSKCKKELDKDEKNRIKTDLANLRRCLRKDKPEKMNETEEANLRQAKSQLEASANHLMVLYSTEQDAGRQ